MTIPLTQQLTLAIRILNSMRRRMATPEDIATQEAIVATLERQVTLEEIGMEMGVTQEIKVI